jgi:ribosomal protein S18 acetylase RimI-like enzyme
MVPFPHIDSRVISCLTIRSEYSGHNIGKKLIKAVLGMMKQEDWSRVEVITSLGEMNLLERWQSRDFYKKLGFVADDKYNNKHHILMYYPNPWYSKD